MAGTKAANPFDLLSDEGGSTDAAELAARLPVASKEAPKAAETKSGA